MLVILMVMAMRVSALRMCWSLGSARNGWWSETLIGTGKGYCVLELVEAFERVNDIKIPYVIDDRRAGDVPVVYSDPSKAERELGWRAEYGINEMVRDSWNWQKRNPNGYE